LQKLCVEKRGYCSGSGSRSIAARFSYAAIRCALGIDFAYTVCESHFRFASGHRVNASAAVRFRLRQQLL